MLHDRGLAILAVAASHHYSEYSLKRSGYHSRHLVNTARQFRYIPPHCGKLAVEGRAVLPLLTLEGVDPSRALF